MLALLECMVTSLGGTYAMEDTDSMAIVATESGGLVPCSGGPLRTGDEIEAIWAQCFELKEFIDPVKAFFYLTAYSTNHLMHLGETIHAKQFIYFYCAFFANPAQVVTNKVYHHHVLGLFFRTVAQRFFQKNIF